MTIDYDVLRGLEVDHTDDASLGALAGRRRSKLAAESDVDDGEASERVRVLEMLSSAT
jgi:hypothetical protein